MYIYTGALGHRNCHPHTDIWLDEFHESSGTTLGASQSLSSAGLRGTPKEFLGMLQRPCKPTRLLDHYIQPEVEVGPLFHVILNSLGGNSEESRTLLRYPGDRGAPLRSHLAYFSL